MTTIAVQYRRGTTIEHSTFTGLLGEVTVDITKDTLVVHDASTVGGFPLQKEISTTNQNGKILGADANGLTFITSSGTGNVLRATDGDLAGCVNAKAYSVRTKSGALAIDIAADPTAGQVLVATSATAGKFKTINLQKAVRLKFIGELITQFGVDRWYPDVNVTLKTIYLSFGIPPTGDTLVKLNKNGVWLMDIPSTANSGVSTQLTGLTTALTPADYLTADIATAGGGKNLTVTIIYEQT